MKIAHMLAVIPIASIFLTAGAQTLDPHATGLSPGESMARLIGITSEIDQLKALSGSTGAADHWQILWLHQHISEEVLAASLQVDATIAQIDNEIARANEVRGYLADRRDRTVNRVNLISVIVGGGLGATSSGLQLSSSLNRPAAAVGIGAGTLSAGLALAGLHAQAGKSSPFDFESNMLAEFFDRPALPDSHYPASVRAFLDEAAPSASDGQTRRQQLLQTWVRVRRIDSLANADKIDRITSQPSEQLKLSIDDFEDRAAMLQDVRARISFLKRDLGTLLASLPPVKALNSSSGP